MDERGLAYNVFNLILLESSDKVPVAFKIQSTEALNFGKKFLYPVLTQVFKTAGYSCLCIFHGEDFGHSDKGNRARLSSGQLKAITDRLPAHGYIDLKFLV